MMLMSSYINEFFLTTFLLCGVARLAACAETEVDIMTVDNIEGHLDPSSNPADISNIVPRAGVRDDWNPSSDDTQPTIRVDLPDVNGIPPTDYRLTTLRVVADNFALVTVTVTDANDNVVFTVSFRC